MQRRLAGPAEREGDAQVKGVGLQGSGCLSLACVLRLGAVPPHAAAQDLLNGRPGDARVKGWLRLTASGPLLLFWPYGPALYAWINGYATGIAHHQGYLQARPLDRGRLHTTTSGFPPSPTDFARLSSGSTADLIECKAGADKVHADAWMLFPCSGQECHDGGQREP